MISWILYRSLEWKSFDMRAVVSATEDLFKFILSDKGLRDEVVANIFDEKVQARETAESEGHAMLMRVVNGLKSFRHAVKLAPEVGGYKQYLNKDGLKGKRLGVVRNTFLALLNRSKAVATFEHHLYTLRQGGATIVDNLEITNVDVILDPYQSGEVMVMLAEFKLARNDYLKGLITSPVWSLSDVITFNMNNADLEKTKIFYASKFTNGLGEEERMAIEAMENLSRDGIEKLMKENKLDAMVTPGSGASSVLAIGGYLAISVPAGYDSDGMPFGICFGGLKGTESKLIEIAYGFEQATMEDMTQMHIFCFGNQQTDT
ncbi:unnamed protein product [Camellia sinensis]